MFCQIGYLKLFFEIIYSITNLGAFQRNVVNNDLI